MILQSSIKPPVVSEWIPSGIILGLMMDDSTKNIVISLSKEAGIEHLFQSYIDEEDRLNIYEIIR